MSVLIQDLGQSGMGDAPSQLPLQTLCVTGIPSPRPFPVKARGSCWLASGSVPGMTSGPC